MRHSSSLMLAIGGLAAVLAAAPTAFAQQAQVVRVPMRDGIELVGDLYLPQGPGPFPTLVTKTPYGRDTARGIRTGFVSNGYAVLIVSQRGRFGSEGIFHQSQNEGWLEHPDGYDTIEWAAVQPWSDGQIGTWGTSSAAQWQLTIAPTRPPHLRAMFVSYSANHRVGGRVERGVYLSTGPTWHYSTQTMARPLRTAEDWAGWLAAWEETRLPLIATFLHPELLEQFIHPAYDDYWRDIDPGTRYNDIDVPIYHESGWYDRYVRATYRNYLGIHERGRSQTTRQSQKIIMGPWRHGGAIPSTDDVTFGPDARIDRVALHLRWFDYWLKGIDTGIVEEPPVRVYLMGAERWLEADTWPLPNTQYVPYYLRVGEGRPTGSLNDGRLLREPPGPEAPDEYVHDPYNPVPTIGGDGGFGAIWSRGPQDQRPVEGRILTFTTELLEEDLEVVGEVRVRFFASSSAVDTDFVVTLTDVFPSGYSAILRQNAIRGRYRLSEETESLLEPDQVYEFTLTLDAVANLFKTGHRVRVGIASSSFPHFLPNPGTAAPLHLATQGVTARNVIYHDGQHPSAIELPVIIR